MTQQFLVQQQDLTQTQLHQTQELTPAQGEVVLQVDRFALTANNITYGVAGDMIGYWKFFPANAGWGQIPVWGIATVTHSNHPEVSQGTRYYGYYPMATELLVQPEKVTGRGFTDAAAHRSELPVVYNHYSLVSENNGFRDGHDNHAMLYRPLFTTSFVLDDYFFDNNFFGAKQIILGSASSKTAFGLAFLLHQRKDIELVGLTSTGNLQFTKSLGLYDQVVSYERVNELGIKPSAYIDMAGNPTVLAAVHQHLTDQLLNSCGVGITHWESRDGSEPVKLPGAKPTTFFAPSQIVKRQKELGPAVYQQQIADATAAFFAQVDNWVEIQEVPYADIEQVYRTVLNGPAPNQGYIVTGEG